MITLELLTLAAVAVVVLLVTLKGWPFLLGAILLWGLAHWYYSNQFRCGPFRAPSGPTVDVPPTA